MTWLPMMLVLALSTAAGGQPESATHPASRPANVRTYIYKKTPQADLSLYVHLPPGWKSSDRRPAIIFFFGGGWAHGTVEQFAGQAEYLAGRGMVAVRPDYRVYGRHKVMPDKCIEDARSAVRWVRGHAGELGIDPGRIAVSGGSAGGHLAAWTGLDGGPEAPGEDRSVSSKANALILFNPVLDPTREPLIQHVKGNRALLEQISPYLHLGKNVPPTLILFGTKDAFFAPAPAYIAKSKELGNRVELYTAEGAVHGFFNRPPWYEPTLRRADEFLIEIGYLHGQPTVDSDANGRKGTPGGPPATRPAGAAAGRCAP